MLTIHTFLHKIKIFSEREKKLSISSLICAADKNAAVRDKYKPIENGQQLSQMDNCNTELAYEPSVGRWGCEWPS